MPTATWKATLCRVSRRAPGSAGSAPARSHVAREMGSAKATWTVPSGLVSCPRAEEASPGSPSPRLGAPPRAALGGAPLLRGHPGHFPELVVGDGDRHQEGVVHPPALHGVGDEPQQPVPGRTELAGA